MILDRSHWLVRSRKTQMLLALTSLFLAALLPYPQISLWVLIFFSLLLFEVLLGCYLRRRWWEQAGECRYMSGWERRILVGSAVVASLYLILFSLVYFQSLGAWSLLSTAMVLWLLLAISEFWASIHLLSRHLLRLLPSEGNKGVAHQGDGPKDLTIQIRSQQDIIGAILRAKREGRSVRAVGSRCSSIPYRAPGKAKKHLQLDLTEYNEVITFTAQERRIHVQAGMLQSKLCDLLKKEGLALPALNGSGKLTVGGTISTGSVCGSRFLLSDCVLSVTLIDADGKVIRVDRQKDADIFGAYLCSLGLLGVLSSIEYQLVPAFVVRGDVKNISFEEMLQLSESIHGRSLDYSIHDWYPLVGRVVSRQLKRLPETEKLTQRKTQPAMTPTESMLGQLLTATVNQFPLLKSPVMKLFVALFKPGPVEAWWDELISVDPEFDLSYHPIEYLEIVLKRSQYRDYMQELYDFYQCHPEKIPYVPIITDWIAPDQVGWISKNSVGPNEHEPFAAITIAYQLIEKDAGAAIFQPAIDIAKSYEARMHWGKHPWLKDPQSIADSLPPGHFERFAALRAQKDPDGRFMTDYFHRLFPKTQAPGERIYANQQRPAA